MITHTTVHPSTSVQRGVECTGDGYRRWRSMVLGLFGGGLMWLSFPPVGWWPVGWIATIPWLLLIHDEVLPGDRPYRQLYVAGLVNWLALIQWMRLPHWMANFGWLALSAYLAVYLPLFVAIGRHMVHRWRWSLVVAAPVVWTGLELARGHMLTGFSMLLLGHSQVDRTVFLQIADVGGAYLVGSVMTFVAAALVRSWRSCQRSRSVKCFESISVWPLACAAACVGLVYCYGAWRMALMQSTSTTAGLPVGLIQGSIDTEFENPVHPVAVHSQYLQLSLEAIQKEPALKLLIWPESMYYQFGEPPRGPELTVVEAAQMGGPTALATASRLGRPLLAGCHSIEVRHDAEFNFNSILRIDADGTRGPRYDKMHPVMFGEYIPLGNMFPWLYSLSPMGQGLTAGERPVCFVIEGINFCPNICFENTVPHLIRRQVRELIAQNQSPDVLVTATNDGWFWGSSLLDHHLACAVFRAIEMRRPMLVAANTGISAWVDSAGSVRSRGPRRAEGLVVAKVGRHVVPESIYLRIGDVPAGACLACCLAAVLGRLSRRIVTFVVPGTRF